MFMVPVNSSMIQSIGYNQFHNTLHVKMHNGGHYRYSGVSEYEFVGMLNAPSVGAYYNHNIKGQFDCRKIRVID